MLVTLILAATVPALGIGRNGSLPWRLSREMRYFKQVTSGHVVVMGRKTWESIPKKFRPLQDRKNIVVTRSEGDEFKGATTATSLDEALALAKEASKGEEQEKHVFIIGGAQLYKTAMAHPDTGAILLTEIHDHGNVIECDRFFEYNSKEWVKSSTNELQSFVGEHVDLPANAVDEENGIKFEYTLHKRILNN